VQTISFVATSPSHAKYWAFQQWQAIRVQPGRARVHAAVDGHDGWRCDARNSSAAAARRLRSARPVAGTHTAHVLQRPVSHGAQLCRSRRLRRRSIRRSGEIISRSSVVIIAALQVSMAQLPGGGTVYSMPYTVAQPPQPIMTLQQPGGQRPRRRNYTLLLLCCPLKSSQSFFE
jgi:hypothetical protein